MLYQINVAHHHYVFADLKTLMARRRQNVWAISWRVFLAVDVPSEWLHKCV